MTKPSILLLTVLMALGGCAGAGSGGEGPPPQAAGVASAALKEAGWKPLADLAGEGREVIRSASVFNLVSRSYVQVERSGTAVTLTLTDATGRSLTRPLPAERWAALDAARTLALAPIDAKAAERNLRRVIARTGHCHGWSDVETLVAGRAAHAWASECQGDATRAAQALAASVNRTALDLFPECGRAESGREVVSVLSLCLARIERGAGA